MSSLTITVTEGMMCKEINQQLTMLLESAGECDPSASYVLYKDWVDTLGNKRELIIPGSAFYQAYNYHDTEKKIDWLVTKNSTFIARLYKRIMGL